MRTVVRVGAGIVGAAFVLLGLWAFAAPDSFYDRIAGFPPYNVHFLHDLGAFQTGLGATLLGALVIRDALVVALAGNAIAAVMHFLAHFVDRDLGGRTSDPITLGLLMMLLVAAVAVSATRRRSLRPRVAGGER